MRKLVFLAMICLLAAGCGPKPVIEGEVSKTVLADDVRVEVNDHEVTVIWKKNGTGNISGYNIYIAPASEGAPVSGKPHNGDPYPGDTNPEDGIEHYPAKDLDNGVLYSVQVSVVFPDGSNSKPSAPVKAVCGARGDMDLVVRYQGDQDGYSFEKNTYVRADNIDNDLYFHFKDGQAFLASPSRLDGFLNQNKLLVLPYRGDYDEVAAKLMESKVTATDDMVEIKKGDWVLIQTAAKKNALVNVTAVNGTGKDTRVSLYFAYCTLIGDVFF